MVSISRCVSSGIEVLLGKVIFVVRVHYKNSDFCATKVQGMRTTSLGKEKQKTAVLFLWIEAFYGALHSAGLHQDHICGS